MSVNNEIMNEIKRWKEYVEIMSIVKTHRKKKLRKILKYTERIRME